MIWWSRLWHRNRMEEQLEKELRFHLDQRESDLIARGQSPAQARREARLALGGPEQVKEKCRDARGTRWAEELLQDGGYALRTFRRKPGFVIVTLLILALGIGATTVMFTIVNSVLLRPLPFPEPDRLVILHGFTEDFGEFWGFSYPYFKDLNHEIRSVRIAGWTYSSGTIGAPGEPEHVEGRQISAELFPILGVVPSCGRGFRSDEDRPGASPVVIISYDLWQRRFASDRAALGKKLIFDGKTYQIVGVAPPGFQLSGEADAFTPLGQSTDPRMQNPAGRFIQVLGRLAPGVTLNQTQAELTLISRHLAEEYPKSNAGLSMRIHPLLQEVVNDVGGTLSLLLAAVGLVLLIACVNIASLFLTRAVSRERELAMRAALGASRSRLVRQCMTESAVLGLCGGLFGIVVAALSVHPFVALWPGNLPRAEEIHIDWRVLCFGAGISLLCGLLFGLTPALRVPMHRLEEALRAGGRSITGNSRRLHSPFVISEIALAFVLLVSAGMLGHTLLTLSSLNPGFNAQNVLAARFALSPKVLDNPSQIRSAWRDVLDRTRHLPEVEFAALADIIPMREGENTLPYRTSPNPPPPNQEPVALASSVTPDYLKVMGIPMLKGRFFNEHDREGNELVVVVDENLAWHAFGRKDVVGQHIWIPVRPWGAAPVEIVGVVAHVRHWGLAGDDQSRVRDQIYYPFAQVPAGLLHFFSSVMSITIRTRSSPLNIVKTLQQELRGASGDQTLYEVRTMEQLVGASLARQRFLSLLFGIFAGLALVLASIGIYGVLAYLTGQRTSEIGVRMAVGANVRDIMRLVLWQGFKMTIAGVSIGMVAALGAAQALQHLVEGMQPVNGATFAIMIPLLMLAALLASFVPARRASMVDPVKALRQE
ncbi:MAG TPA: ABC transporter permease [Verrucomicrobiae bacterium]|nr:ABC transporter permease [Verrucomicrobiae bacterium]